MSDNAMPVLSVIVPVYNAGTYLEECIDSIVDNGVDDLELIIVNDGSDDGSGELARRRAWADSRIRVINIENSGVSVARNTGMDAAKGRWIAFCDADDRFYPGALGTMLDIAKKAENVDMVVPQYDYTDVYAPAETGELTYSVHSGREALAHMLYQDKGWEVQPGKLYRADFVRSFRFMPGRRFEDLELIPRLLVAARTVIHIPHSLYFYRRHGGSFINSDNAGRCDAVGAVQSVAAAIPQQWHECVAACNSRLFSAAFNVFAFASARGMKHVAESSWQIILSHRKAVIADARVRIKNKIGALLSFLGQSVSKRVCSWIYR